MSIFRVIKKFKLILSTDQKSKIIVISVLMILGGLLETISVSLVVPFMNSIMEPSEMMEKWYVLRLCDFLKLQNERTFLVCFGIFLAVIYILKNIYLIIETSIQYQFVYRNMIKMSQRLLANYISRPYEFFLNVNSGEILRIINTDTPYTFTLLSTLLSLFTELVVSVMLIAAVFIFAPEITMILAFILILLVIVFNFWFKPILRESGVIHQEAGTGMNKWLLQSIQGIKELKVMNKESFFLKNYNNYGEKYVVAAKRHNVLALTPKFVIEAICMGSMFIIVSLIIYFGADIELIMPMLTAVVMAALRLLPSVSRISTALSGIAFNEPFLDKLIENLQDIDDSRPDSLLERKGVRQTQNHFEMKDSIIFDNISFRYPNTEENVLNKAYLKINKGEAIGIVGASGSGKTTSVDIMLGLLYPQEGNILKDGEDISNDIDGWHAQIGYIPQMIFMMDDSIRENVAFGIPSENIDDEKVWKALKEASLDSFVRSLPEGLETQIGERGVRLSGGQRQRIGIARALYSNPQILIFDEATSALDNETEATIMESIRKLQGSRTMIIIAHRLSTIETCDSVYRVENGKMIKEK
ncbi:ATP-binding cassette domain-containing protein [bacterium 1XD8-76]|nr:ATP-binding cassette domain-containing protein [bacterium 1XD8-76]